MASHTRAPAPGGDRDGRGFQAADRPHDDSVTAEPAPRCWRIAVEWSGEGYCRDDVVHFVAGMVAATYGPCDTNTVNDCTVIEALGVEPPSEQHVEKWQAIAAATLPRLLMDDGTVVLTVSDPGYVR